MYPSIGGQMNLPHPKISRRVLLVVESSIRKAWELVTTQPRAGFDYRTATEDPLTLELFERLKDHVFNKGLIKGFDRSIFSSINREPKVRNFDRTHPDKMPDLLIEFIDCPADGIQSQHGLFIECKPVDAAHGVGSEYCDKGLIRFIRGDYAWAMQNAMMLGYAAPTHSIDNKLPTALNSKKRKHPLNILVKPIICPHSTADATAQEVVTTSHQRNFQYVEIAKAAGPISIRHLWLKR
ncbi:MAG: hypothetical protein ACI9JZ_002965 [Lentimonas sp.]|jgi:hypothetical protein